MTYNVFGVRRKGDSCSFDTLVAQQVGDDVSIWHSSHGRESVWLRLAGINLTTVLFYGTFCALDFRAVEFALRLYRNASSRNTSTYV